MQHAESLPYLFKSLRLSTAAKHWKVLAEEAQESNLTYAEYLAQLLDLELANREQNRLLRHYKQSKLPAAKTLANFKFEGCPGVSSKQIESLASDIEWVQNAENLILLGPSGVGKTHLACGIAYGVIEKGMKVFFSNTTLLVQTLQQAKAELRLKKELERLARFDLLVLDDIGYIQKSEQETSVLFELIDCRYEQRSLIITANQPFSEWHTLFPDKVMAVAAIDRLIHHSKIINIKAESYRAKQAKEKNL